MLRGIRFSQMDMARRYLLGALVAALIPLALIAGLYDRYSADLLRKLVTNRVEANLEATAAAMSNFMSVQINTLENIADLPDTTMFFRDGGRTGVSALLADILRLEAENPDVYAVELSGVSGNILHTTPAARRRSTPGYVDDLPQVQHDGVEVLGPVMPENGRPGWFLITMPVRLDQEMIGAVSLRVRLASLTEETAALMQPGVFEPQIVVSDRIRVTAVGTLAATKEILASSRQFFPGWHVQLVKGNGALQEPKTYIRYLLLVAAALSALCLIYLFRKMSARVTGYLQPLSEGAHAVANGDFNVPVSEDAPGELGILAGAYNRMRLQLGKLIESRIDVERRAALGNMAAGIAHEIRNPLTTVLTTVHGLQRSEKDPDRQEMFEVISSEIARVESTIAEFLRYAKPSEPQQDVVAVKEVLRSIKTLVATAAHDKNIIINLSGESNLKVVMDKAHCRQILLNLALNAIAAMPDGGHLSLRAYRDHRSALLVVSDDGVGMDEELQSKVLRPFFTTGATGSGLGLSVTKQLVEANGGTLSIESEAGVGTTVTVAFPHQGTQGRAAP